MARKIRLTRLELKRQRDALARYERYLPTLKLKQQQLQMNLQLVAERTRKARAERNAARDRFAPYRDVLADVAGLNVEELALPAEVVTTSRNVAGVRVPEFAEARFKPASYSLFATPPWVDRALADLRDIQARQAKLDTLRLEEDILRRELTRILQRVNLFEKVMIPRTRDIIRRIRIHLGDEMTAAVVRAKIAKDKLVKTAAPTVAAAGPAESPAGEAAP